MANLVRRMWDAKYPAHAREVRYRLGILKCGMREERYPLEVRRALMLRYREIMRPVHVRREAEKERRR